MGQVRLEFGGDVGELDIVLVGGEEKASEVELFDRRERSLLAVSLDETARRAQDTELTGEMAEVAAPLLVEELI